MSAGNDLQRLLLGHCAGQLRGTADVLEWGDGAGMAHALRCLGGASRGVAIIADARIYQAAQDARADGNGAAREIIFVPVADASSVGFAAHRDYALSPASLQRSFALVIVAGAARPACVTVAWLLLEPAGVILLRHRPDDRTAQGAIPQGAAVLKVTGPADADGFILIAKDAAVIDAIAAAAHGSLPAGYQTDAPAAPAVAAASAPAPVLAPPPPPVRTQAAPPVRSGRSTPPASSCVFINTYYPAFLEAHYQRHPELLTASYADQKAHLQATCFGDSDFYSAGLTQAGWTAEDLVANCGPLQRAWAREAGLDLPDYLDILIEQLKRLRPQVIYLQDLSLATSEILARLRPLADLIVGQIASPVPPQAQVAGLDIVFTSFPHFATRFRRSGITSYYQPLAFDPRVLDLPLDGGPRHPLTFVGGISPEHPAGTALLSALIDKVPIEIYGYGADALPADSPIRMRHRGEVWGDKMFGLMRSSAITVNRHIAVAETNANNMRLFEATGCGALLITDHKTNLGELFEIGKEIVAYRSPEECVALCQYYLAHPDQAALIARAGQLRTLRDHSYAQRMADTAEILGRHLRIKREAAQMRAVNLGVISGELTPLAADAVTTAMTQAWKDNSIPGNQRALVERELASMYKGAELTLFEVMARSLRPVLTRHPAARILDIGCASGYYREVLRYLLGRPVHYTGIDYSATMIAMAKDYYPNGEFLVADGAQLPFPDQAFPVVISSGVLLHVPNYRQHVKETARVAGNVVVVHRTQICRARKTHHLQKKGYGVDMVELFYNEDELVALLDECGLDLASIEDFHADPQNDQYGVTYVCQKKGKELF